jgi:hypothetical protein
VSPRFGRTTGTRRYDPIPLSPHQHHTAYDPITHTERSVSRLRVCGFCVFVRRCFIHVLLAQAAEPMTEAYHAPMPTGTAHTQRAIRSNTTMHARMHAETLREQPYHFRRVTGVFTAVSDGAHTLRDSFRRR